MSRHLSFVIKEIDKIVEKLRNEIETRWKEVYMNLSIRGFFYDEKKIVLENFEFFDYESNKIVNKFFTNTKLEIVFHPVGRSPRSRKYIPEKMFESISMVLVCGNGATIPYKWEPRGGEYGTLKKDDRIIMSEGMTAFEAIQLILEDVCRREISQNWKDKSECKQPSEYHLQKIAQFYNNE
jgi:hypothetical protein